jgi:hypothetical protein
MNLHRTPDRRGSLIASDPEPTAPDASAAGQADGWNLLAPAAGEPDLLAAPIDDTDLAATLIRPGSGRPPAGTAVLAVLLVAGLGFTGGVFAQKAMAPAAAAAASRSSTAAAGGAAGGAAAGRGVGGVGGAAGSAAAGTVQLVDGTTIYVQSGTGGVTKVLTGPSTTIKVTITGTVKDLAPGTVVVVQGVRAADGTVTASGITQGGSGAGGFGRAGTTNSAGGGSGSATTPAG